MNEYQLVEADKPGQVEKLCSQLLEQIRPHPGARDLSARVETFQQRRQVRRAVRGRVLVDLSHGQVGWNFFPDDRPSILELDWLRTRVDSTLAIETIEQDEITVDRLAPCAGLIVPIPREAFLSAREREAIVAWVLEGGRLLLLGYELGDYHHRSNLNALAFSFGLHFESDIVAPPTAKSGDPRIHGQELMFDVGDGHPVTAGLSQIALTNVQTIRAEPGAQPLIVVGRNLVGRPSNDPRAVRYQTGKWVLVAPERLEYAPALQSEAVLVAAPPGLTGKGHVLGLGTWWTGGAGPDTDLFLRNMMRWLGDLA